MAKNRRPARLLPLRPPVRQAAWRLALRHARAAARGAPAGRARMR
ncbi:hypothetical protein [Janthinobacterium sp. 78]|nr:hypothetical protein [Janthinobacterium sp. 78]